MAPGCIYWSLPRGEVPSDGAEWGREKVQEPESQISLSLALASALSPRRHAPQPLPLALGRDLPATACRAARASEAWGVQLLSKQEAWSPEHSQGN